MQGGFPGGPPPGNAMQPPTDQFGRMNMGMGMGGPPVSHPLTHSHGYVIYLYL